MSLRNVKRFAAASSALFVTVTMTAACSASGLSQPPGVQANTQSTAAARRSKAAR